MRFPYIELRNNAEKYIERKMTTAAPSPSSAKPGPVAVEEDEPVMQSAPSKKSPEAVAKEQEQRPATLNEQHPFFE
jgi:hypothetical protein